MTELLLSYGNKCQYFQLFSLIDRQSRLHCYGFNSRQWSRRRRAEAEYMKLNWRKLLSFYFHGLYFTNIDEPAKRRQRILMKINFLNYLDKKGILFLSETTKEDVLNAMVVRAAELCRIPVDILKEAVWERERKVSTGLGNGLALPHVRLTRFGEPLVVLGISKEGIADYQTTDDTTIDMIVLLIADGRDTDLYLELMKSAILKLKARKNIEAVKQCGDDPVAVINLLRHL